MKVVEKKQWMRRSGKRKEPVGDWSFPECRAGGRAAALDDGVGDRGRGEGTAAAVYSRVQAPDRARGGPLHHAGGDRGAAATRGAVLVVADDVAGGARSRRTRGAGPKPRGPKGVPPDPRDKKIAEQERELGKCVSAPSARRHW